MFTLSNHRLDAPAQQRPSPKFSAGRTIRPRFLIFHYTVIDFEETVRAFVAGPSEASAHLLVGRDGRVVQFVDFNRRAWHAGESRWQELSDLNTHSIGIEVENSGWLLRQPDGRFVCSRGRNIEDIDVIEARHKNPAMPYRWWHAYTQLQLDACAALAQLLCREYGLVEVLGHDDVAPTRKADPGPAFPLTRMVAAGLGREDPLATAPTAGVLMRVVPELLNLRTGPGTGHTKAPVPLAQGVWVRRLAIDGPWARVSTEEALPREGWVWAAFLAPYSA
jgi:N-acetylmuramoyl-L-alanine amidase